MQETIRVLCCNIYDNLICNARILCPIDRSGKFQNLMQELPHFSNSVECNSCNKREQWVIRAHKDKTIDEKIGQNKMNKPAES